MLKDFKFSTPESNGISSDSILKFIKKIKDNKINLHSFIIVRNDCVLAEGYYKPFNKDFKHRLYSASKSIVSLAIGKLVKEGLIKLDDKLIKYFPEYNIANDRKWFKDTTIEDVLKMSVPILTDTYYDRLYKDWAWTFFNRQSDLKPAGTIFNYNTSGTFILCVLVEKITGMTFIDYLRDIFDEIGVSNNVTCVKSPDGYAWGGSGVIMPLRDFALVSDLIMKRGIYNGKELLPYEYMLKATTKRMPNLNENDYHMRSSEGYGYQMWISKYGFGLYGMGSQLAFLFPDKNLMFVCQGDTQSSNDTSPDRIYDMFIDTIYDSLSDVQLDENIESYKKLEETIQNLELNNDFGEAHSSYEKKISGKTFDLLPNPMGWKWFKIDTNEADGVITYENSRGIKKIKFGMGKFIKGTFPETDYYDLIVDTKSNRELDSISSLTFLSETEILIRNYIIDTNLGNCFMVFSFKGDEVGIEFNKRAEFFLDDYQGFAGGFIRK